VLISTAPAVRCAARLYVPLGASLWIAKMRAPLPKLLGEPGSYATGRVRPDCVQVRPCRAACLVDDPLAKHQS
jgi:hypothetical protein